MSRPCKPGRRGPPGHPPHGELSSPSPSSLCDTQEEVDRYWDALSASPGAESCGWLKDGYGVSWQTVARVLLEMLQDSDPQKVARVTATFLGMKKLEIAAPRASFEGT